MKSKIDCKAIAEGKKGAKLQIKVHDEVFGTMKCQIDYHLVTEEMGAAVQAAVAAAEATIDGMEVDITDPASTAAYVGTCSAALAGLMTKVQAVLG